MNKSLKDWVSFVKRVQKRENIGYRDAMMRAKTLKNQGEKWQSGGEEEEQVPSVEKDESNGAIVGGKRRNKTSKKQKNRRRKTSKKN